MTNLTPSQHCAKLLLAKITEEQGRLTSLVQELQLIKNQEITTPLLNALATRVANMAPGLVQSMSDSTRLPAAQINYELLKVLQRIAQFAGKAVNELTTRPSLVAWSQLNNLRTVENLVTSGRTDLFVR